MNLKNLVGFALLAVAASQWQTKLAGIAAEVNSMDTTWKAEDPAKLLDKDVSDFQKLCGTWMKDHPLYERLPELNTSSFNRMALPDSWDWREQTKCASVHGVRDQSDCGSCWAFSAAETFNDRRCIKLGDTAIYSPEDTVSCCSGFGCGFSQGCNGGQPGAALAWMTRAGVVTGGDFTTKGSGSSCRPYSLQPCAHHVPPTAKYPTCPSSEYPTPKCTKQCESSYTKSYADDKTLGVKAYSLSGEQNIMQDLMANGPLSVAFTVYGDFPAYKSGVYKHVSGSALGGHAVEMVGWGTDNGTPYWIIKNSWNEQWGDAGHFKILRGSNECGIEGEVNGINVQ